MLFSQRLYVDLAYKYEKQCGSQAPHECVIVSSNEFESFVHAVGPVMLYLSYPITVTDHVLCARACRVLVFLTHDIVLGVGDH